MDIYGYAAEQVELCGLFAGFDGWVYNEDGEIVASIEDFFPSTQQGE